MSTATVTRRQLRADRVWRLKALPLTVCLSFLMGVGIVLYPTAAAWLHQLQQSNVIAGLSDEIQQLPADGLGEALDAARRHNAGITGEAIVAANANVPTAVPADGAGSYREQLAANSGGLMARVKIPSIAVDLPIYHGTSDQTLLRGVGHLEGTTLPVGGPSTHAVLTAHRGLADAELFTNLDRVVEGDTFTVEVFGEVLTYRVRETQVVDPTETETLRPVRGEDLITLVTCTPLGINTQRILVTGERITPTPVEDIEAAGKTPEIPGFPWWALVCGGVAIAGAAYVWAMGRPAGARSHSAGGRPRSRAAVGRPGDQLEETR
jgi:sortase A